MIIAGDQIAETAIVTNDKTDSSAENTTTTISSSVPLTVVTIPSPSTHVASLPHHNASVVVTVSTEIGMEIVVTSSVSAMVTPLAANKTASLIKGINALEGNNLIVRLLLLCSSLFICF